MRNLRFSAASEYLELSINFNEKFNSLKNKLGNIGENKLLLITSITTMDEYFELPTRDTDKPFLLPIEDVSCWACPLLIL